jgi:antitoxin CptB
MSGTTRSSADLDPRRRRLLFHAWHRGTREMDLLMGRFADAEIGTLPEARLDEFEALMQVPDPDLFEWITGRKPVPANYDNELVRHLVAFCADGAARIRETR